MDGEQAWRSLKHMSFREKSAWISLVSNLAVYGWYFATLAAAWLADRADADAFGWRLIAAFAVLVILEIVLHVAAAVRAPEDALAPEDERERLIALKSTNLAYGVLASGVVLSIAALLGDGAPFAVLNLLFFALVLATVANYASLIVRFRVQA
jgi:hypothetical protein